MDTEKNRQASEPLVDFKRLRQFVIYPVMVLLGLWVGYLWLPPAFEGFAINRGRNSAMAPLREQANALGLTYEMVLAKPHAADGKPVVWCVQNRAADLVSVNGEATKSLRVSNYPMMPVFTGSKHESCTIMLLIVEKSEPDFPVTVFFKEVI